MRKFSPIERKNVDTKLTIYLEHNKSYNEAKVICISRIQLRNKMKDRVHIIIYIRVSVCVCVCVCVCVRAVCALSVIAEAKKCTAC